MNLIFLGDIVGKSGRRAVHQHLPDLIERSKADVVIANGENAAGGFGINEKIYLALRESGVDVVTTGNHVWDQRDALVFIDRHPRLLRPLNYPKTTPGKGFVHFETKAGLRVLVINVMGQLFMGQLDCPFRALDEILNANPLKDVCDVICIDFHAEATSEKQGIGHFVDGRASVVVGTHTHVPTADYQILPGGTAYMTDAGMCGDYDSVIGMDKTEPVQRFIRKIPEARLSPALGEATVCGLGVEIDETTGLAVNIAPFRIGGRLAPTFPDFWQ